MALNLTTKFSHHEACPKCGSKDNLGVWTDGHKWCFGCHHYVDKNGDAIVKEWVKKQTQVPDVQKKVVLPADYERGFVPKWAMEWLEAFHLDRIHIDDNDIGYDLNKDLLIFPIYGQKNELLAWQGRYFGHDPKKPKYYTQGNVADIIHIRDTGAYEQQSVVVVEDLVSAIRVGEIIPAVPLFGSHLSLQRATRLSKMFNHLIIYLDQDKFKEAQKFKSEYQLIFDSIEVRSTKMDPKYYNATVLRDVLFDPMYQP